MKYIYILILNLFVTYGYCQDKSVIASLQATSSTTFNVLFTRNGNLDGTNITSIAVFLRLNSVNSPSTTLALSSNPFSLSPQTVAANSGANLIYTFQSLAVRNPTELPNNTTTIIASFIVTGIKPSSVELFSTVSGNIGTNLVMDNAWNEISFPVSASTILPITLKSLTAKKFDESSALLEWTSASEVEASHYEVERSLDAQTWNYLATERLRGGNNLEASYTYLDRLSILQRSKPSIVYYRLKLVDLDGSYKYSDVRSVAFEELNEIAVSLYPNPASGQFQFAILSKDGINTATPLVLTDMTGKTVLTQNVTTNAITTISTAGLPVGIYHAHVTVDGQAVTKKIMINY